MDVEVDVDKVSSLFSMLVLTVGQFEAGCFNVGLWFVACGLWWDDCSKAWVAICVCRQVQIDDDAKGFLLSTGTLYRYCTPTVQLQLTLDSQKKVLWWGRIKITPPTCTDLQC